MKQLSPVCSLFRLLFTLYLQTQKNARERKGRLLENSIKNGGETDATIIQFMYVNVEF